MGLGCHGNVSLQELKEGFFLLVSCKIDILYLCILLFTVYSNVFQVTVCLKSEKYYSL